MRKRADFEKSSLARAKLKLTFNKGPIRIRLQQKKSRMNIFLAFIFLWMKIKRFPLNLLQHVKSYCCAKKNSFHIKEFLEMSFV